MISIGDRNVDEGVGYRRMARNILKFPTGGGFTDEQIGSLKSLTTVT